MAMWNAVDRSLLEENGNRPGITDLVFVLTDGKAKYLDNVIAAEAALQSLGAVVSC